MQYIEDVEDAVQSALMTALETWTITDLPDNPSAWLFRVAHNNVMGELRRRTGRRRILEAIRLATILAEHPAGQTPETFALLALMHLHAARMTARQDSSGALLLLEEQERALWDQQRIQVGLEWLAKSAQGDGFSRYHAEAGIAAEHCLAPRFRRHVGTKWWNVTRS